MATCGLEPHGREESIGTTRSDQARGWSITEGVDQPAPIKVAADEVVAEHSPFHCHLFLEHWNTRLFHWNTRAGPSVPDQIVTQRPESHNAHIFSVIGDGRKILERWNTHICQSSSGPAGPSSPPRCHEGVWCRSLWWHSLFTCLKNEEVSVPAFQPRGDLGGSGWKPAQTHFQAI